jgi:hypothetical protein
VEKTRRLLVAGVASRLRKKKQEDGMAKIDLDALKNSLRRATG